MAQLEPCPHCGRHVRLHESTCPFCHGATIEAFARVPPRKMPRAGLSRAALFAFGVSAAATTLASGCYKESKDDDGERADDDKDAGDSEKPGDSTKPERDAGRPNTPPRDAGTSPVDEDAGGTLIYGAAPAD